MPLPVKPSTADDAAIRTARRLDATATGLVLAGWPMLVMGGFAVGVSSELLGIVAAAGFAAFILSMMGFANLREVQKRIVARRLEEEESGARKFAVECTVNAFTTTRDFGILWREGNLLRFEGTESEFSIPSDAVAAALPALDAGGTVHLPLRRGQSITQISLRGIAGNAARVTTMVEEWAGAQLYGGDDAGARVELTIRRPNPLNVLFFIVPCAPLAVYVSAMGSDFPILFMPCFLILAFGVWRLLAERRRLFADL